MIKGLNEINIDEEIQIVDVHRLPQCLIFIKNNQKKLANSCKTELLKPLLKAKILFMIKKPEAIKKKRKRKSPFLPYVYFTEHLCKELQR